MSKTKKRTLQQLQKNILLFANELPVFGEWLDDIEIAKIENDASVLSAVSIRKSTTLKKELIIETKQENIKKELEKLLSYNFRSQVLDTFLQGFSIFELNWYEKDSLYYPNPIERDYRMFSLKENKLFYNLQEVDEFKAIYLLSRAKFNSPLGRPLYHTLFWLRKFKAASLEFWVEFLEKFGTPWVIGKTSGDKNILAEELYNMLGGDVAVIEEDDSIDLKTPTNKGGFSEIVEYLDNQIYQAILGGNLTANIKSGSYAAAKTHKELSEDLSLSDANLLKEAINTLLQKFKDLNHIKEPIEFKLKDQDDPNIELASRDANLKNIMADEFKFTKEYLEKTYHIDIEPSTKTIENSLSFSNKPTPKHLSYQDEHLFLLDAKELTKELEQVYTILNSCSSYEEALAKIEKISNPKLEKALESYIFANGVLSELD